jgi:hypothetical protein
MKTLKTIAVMLVGCTVAVGYALVGATYTKGGLVKLKAKNGHGYAKAGAHRRRGHYV